MYGIPVRQLQGQLTAAEFSELMAADLCGLVPDPWQQTGILAATIANTSGKLEQAARPDDFIPQRRPRQDMAALYEQRKRLYGTGHGRSRRTL